MYDVTEIELTNMHQDETSFDNELEEDDPDQGEAIDDDGLDEPAPVYQRIDGEISTIPGNLQFLISRREEDMARDRDCQGSEDDIVLEYFSENDRDPMECNDDD
ncbi:hypothetical protein GUJ93_ZPchr0011g28703 [Zizania palustris]|uniref:Uncharacterized protein n=1 Tax=Zizania palustris TaxID=103762 RepID=A0A8J5WK02_ZIZPA|nr:hypothetical protein GUJ93_ZPchr0011g28703 [Zizania palustris]